MAAGREDEIMDEESSMWRRWREAGGHSGPCRPNHLGSLQAPLSTGGFGQDSGTLVEGPGFPSVGQEEESDYYLLWIGALLGIFVALRGRPAYLHI